jgi:anti-sigma factor RsiW
MIRRSQARMVDCADSKTFAQSYVDGELAGPEREAWERHMDGCPGCRGGTNFEARFKAAIRGHLPRRAPGGELEQRIRSAIAQEPRTGRWTGWLTLPRALPLAVAVVGVLVVVAGAVRGRQSFVLDQAGRSYQAELPLDVMGPDCSSVASWFRGRVDFPVHAPRMPNHAKCQGGRLVNVADRPAAYLVYQEPTGHRVAVLVFDAELSPIDAPYRRVVEGHEVFYRNGPGISTAAFQARGLGYAVTSDLDEDSLTQLVRDNFRQ